MLCLLEFHNALLNQNQFLPFKSGHESDIKETDFEDDSFSLEEIFEFESSVNASE